ncbi:unnamed protein product [Didymodactylos carnosus]|uniref:Uncharacterized protein n=1 Tax=Didymodactylos carnosus TaxID=1234261 RepID=A0A814D0E9_9BILA|nr:unnamed protein product [Didymodactylos carnosus]CAF1199925.1 unnamed protein product [Didymodactylos carnosus]CAF3723832.1 unnamed protein product [Didymodactylos carnosus]CAF4010047.1 unnamed protein product [Didymodactylos carnosus]
MSSDNQNADLNSDGKPYHTHGDHKEKDDKCSTGKCEHSHDEKDHVPHHGHDNQYHKDLKGSIGSGSATHSGDHKKESCQDSKCDKH